MGGRGARSGLRGGGGHARNSMDLSVFQSLHSPGQHATPLEAIKRVNPNYSQDRIWQINCQRCVWAYELQRRGFDVEAKPHLQGYDPYPHGKWQKVIKDFHSQTVTINARNASEAIREMDKQMTAWGEGARGIVRVAWANSNSGHVFNVERESGKTVYYEAQVGYKPNIEQRMKQVDYRYSVTLTRSDNAEFTRYVDDVAAFTKKRRRN